MNKERIIKIYSGTLWEAEMVKSLLQAANVDSFLKNTVLDSYAYEPIGSDGVHVMILESNVQEAKEVIDLYNRTKVNH